MKRTLGSLALPLAATTLLGLGLTASATASPDPGDTLATTGTVPAAPTPATRLHLTVTDAAGVVTDVFLGCRPTGGNHPSAELACGALHEVGGDFDALKGDPDMPCTDEYAPVTATAEGTYDKVPVSWEKVFGNACELTAGTTPVFAF
ncbi:SSI family serine proteinase inhibitor [Streptomyces sp. NPDC056144]|uniref:SSI family serine proteinase inhibitor n=1 Tax=unclassified Streptomyces TaxID=2593676 RepID=UPI0035E30F27